MATEEVIYRGSYDNTIDLRLESDKVAIDLSTATTITANIEGVTTSSTNQSSDLIRWDQAGYETGEIRCQLGELTGLSVGTFDMWIIVEDTLNTDGIVFPPIVVRVVDLP